MTFRKLNLGLIAAWLLSLLLFSIALPPFFAPDETTHWAWMSRFATHRDPFIDGGCSVAEKTVHAFQYEAIYRSGRAAELPRFGPLPTDSITDADCRRIPYTGMYAHPTLYLPTYLISQLGLDWSATYYLGRGLQLLLALLLVGMLWRRLPAEDLGAQLTLFGHLVMLALPVVLQQTLAVTSDYFVILAALALITIYFDKYFRPTERGLALFLVLLGAIAKPVVMPVLLSLALLKLLSAERRSRITGVLLCAICAFAIARGLYFLMFGFSAVPETASRSALQFAFIRDNPLRALWIIVSTSWLKLFQLPGTRMGWQAIQIPLVCYVLGHLPIAVYFGALLKLRRTSAPESYDVRIAKYRNKIFAGAALSFVFLTGLTLYLSYTQPGRSVVVGLQARYYLPLISFLVYGLATARRPRLELSASTMRSLTYVVLGAVLLNSGLVAAKILQLYPY